MNALLERMNIARMLTSSKTVSRFYAVPIKIPMTLLLQKASSKYRSKKRCHIAQGILRKKNKSGGTKILHVILQRNYKKDNTGLVPNDTHTGSNRMETLQLKSQQPAF